jgi:copper transport protein
MPLSAMRSRLGTPRVRWLRAATVLAMAAAWIGTLPTPAAAHAIVERTDPAIDAVVDPSPSHISIWFNEPVEIAFGSVRVFDTTGRRVDIGEPEHLPGDAASARIELRPALPDGTYTVAWRVISADGHPIQEAFVFHVREPGPNPQGIGDRILGQTGARGISGVAYGIARWLTFTSMLVLVGGGVFLAYVWGSTVGETTVSSEVRDRFGRRWRGLAFTAWAAAVIGTLASVVLQTAIVADVPIASAVDPSLLGEVATTRFGIVMLARLGLLALAIVLWLAVRPRSTGEDRSPDRGDIGMSRWAFAVGGALGIALLATPGLAGHAGATAPVALNIAADALHLAGGACWVGGLVTLIAVAFPATAVVEPDERVRILAPAVSRFSDMAVIAVGVLVVSALVRAWFEVRAFHALTGTTYGLVLLAKVAAFLPMLGLGAVNNRWAKPRLRKAAESRSPGTAAMRTLRRSMVAEVALAAVVIAATALLVNIAPARVAAGLEGPFITDVRIGSDNLNVIVDPNRVGENEVHLTVTEPNGAATEVEAMRVLFRMPSEGIGPLIGEGVRLAPGHYVVQGRQLSVAGGWTLEVVARTGRFDEERTTVRVTVNEQEGSSCADPHHC